MRLTGRYNLFLSSKQPGTPSRHQRSRFIFRFPSRATRPKPTAVFPTTVLPRGLWPGGPHLLLTAAEHWAVSVATSRYSDPKTTCLRVAACLSTERKRERESHETHNTRRQTHNTWRQTHDTRRQTNGKTKLHHKEGISRHQQTIPRTKSPNSKNPTNGKPFTRREEYYAN